MANIVQMGIDSFWSQLQRLENLAKPLAADLEADRLALQSAYSEARRASDPAVAALHQKLLQPQIHRNSTLRLQFRDLVSKFNQAVNGASAVLKRAGFSTPQLSGLGAAVIIVPVVAVAALLAAFAIYETVRTATDAQRRATTELIKILHDPTSTEAEKAQAAVALAKAAGTPPPLGFDLGAVVPILGLVAVIMLGPQILGMIPKRRAA